ncbi:MAG: hypothetical protein Q9195_006354 [Heterodermia aff. obscurata]
MALTYYQTESGMPPYGGKPPEPKSVPNPNRRYITPSGAPPFGGLPLSQLPSTPTVTLSHTVASTRRVYYTYTPQPVPTPPPTPPAPAPALPAVQYRLIDNASAAPAPQALTYYRQPSPSPPPRYQRLELPAPTPVPVPKKKVRFEPPGCQLNGSTPTFSPATNFSYVFPSAHIKLQYWDDGTQPWVPGGSTLVSRRMVPACMRVKDLIRQLGAPDERKNGITVTRLRVRRANGEEKEFGDVEEGIQELAREGEAGGAWWRWVKGPTYRLGDEGNETLEGLEWKGVVGVAVCVW